MVHRVLRLGVLPGADQETEVRYRQAVGRAAAKGVVGITDFEFGPGYRDWPERLAGGRPAAGAHGDLPGPIGEVIAAGLRSGKELPSGSDLLTLGPRKIISTGR